jgi:tetratricopeptide (TPR) repeat protein
MLPSRPLLSLILICLSACFVVASAWPQQDPPMTHMDKKQLQKVADALVDEGKRLEKQGDLDGAREKFLDAEGYISTSDALDGLKRVREEKDKKSEAMLEQAQGDCTVGKPADCATKLEAALLLGPQKPAALHNDLALSYQKGGDRSNAVSHLDALIVATRDEKERMGFAELRTSLVTGAKAPTITPDIRKRIQEFNAAFAKSDNNPSSDSQQTASSASITLCDRIKDLQPGPATNPAVLYNAAKCAEEDGDDAPAADLLGQYLKAAPDSLDARDVQIHRDSLLSLAALTGDTGVQVRAHFAAAARDLDYRRYDRANLEYQAAQQIAPSFALTYWRMGIMAEASANVTLARVYLQRFIQLETNTDRKNDAAMHLASLDQWHSDYIQNVDEAHDLMADLLTHSMGLDSEGVQRKTKLNKAQNKASSRTKMMLAASETLSGAYVRRQLDQARADLEEATQLFPIAPEANEMLALLDLEENDWPSAYRSFDAVASAGMPVSFYAQLYDSKDNKNIRATKIEIGRETVRFVYLDTYNPKKRISEPPITPAGDDALGNLAVSETNPPDPAAQSTTISVSDLEGVQTAQNFVIMKQHKEQTMLAPVYMVAFTPVEGKTAREFGNEYTRLFVRYLGYENARLGKEGMTFGEKLKLGYQIYQTGMSIYDAVITGGLDSYGAFQETRKLVGKLRTDLASLQRKLADQRRVLEGLQFKAIPTEPVVLVYRDHL